MIDDLAFKFERLDWFNEGQIKDYLFELGFNIYNGFPPRAKGSIFHFPGKSGEHFYALLKKNCIEWIFFESAILERFDLCYIRHHKKSDKISIVDFFLGCLKKMESTNRNVQVEKNKLGVIENH